MNARSGQLLLWSPLILSILVCLFLSLFAFDAFGDVTDSAMHLAPMLFLLVVVVVSTRWELVGAVAFTGLAVAYAYFARNHVSWIAVISHPLLVVGGLFFLSWRHQRDLRAHT